MDKRNAMNDLVSPRILAVDDDAATRQLIYDYLTENELRVSTVASGHGHGAKIRLTMIPARKAASAPSLPLRLIAPRVRHARICGPICRCSTSHASSCGDERAKQKTEHQLAC